MSYKILELDNNLKPYESEFDLRMANYHRKKNELLGDGKTVDS